jgi:hypothetical protein
VISSLELTAREDIERMFNLDLLAYIDVVRAFFPPLRANRGRVVNVGSVSVEAPVPGWGVYSGVKAGIENLTPALGHRCECGDLLEGNARNLELSMKGGTPAVNVAKTIRDVLVCATSESPRK